LNVKRKYDTLKREEDMMKGNVSKLVLAALVLAILPYESIDAVNEIPDNMVLIPAGWFTMGSKEGHFSHQPPHRVYLDAYAIDKYEVTNADYKNFIDLRDHLRGKKTPLGPNCQKVERGVSPPKIWNENHEYPLELADHPVVCVRRGMAKRYCRTMGKRLPTEAEWEKAARGKDGRKYPWGNKWDPKKTNHGLAKSPWEDASDGYARTAPVGSFPEDKSPYGVYDMAGNVYEWTWDIYWPYYYPRSPKRNPKGPESYKSIPEDLRPEWHAYTVRGGSWALGREAATTWRRGYRRTFQADDSGGFRCVADTK